MTLRPAFLVTALLLFACSPDVATSPDIEPSYARGGNGGGGQPGGSTEILPVQLGDAKALGCSSTTADAINDASHTVVGGYCAASTLSPFTWSSAGGSVFPDTGDVLDVTEAGAIVGRLDFRPFYREAGTAPVYLPMTTGMLWGEVLSITPSGTFAVGSMSNLSTAISALWTRSGGTWSVAEFSGAPAAVSTAGDMIVGSANGRATLWTNPGTWTPTVLPDGGALRSRALAINQTGTVVVGRRDIPLASDPSVEVDQHVAWISNGAGAWTLQVLAGLNVLEGVAYGVATQIDGSVVAVGESWEDKAGRGAQLWAVAWRMPAGASTFGAPVKLSPTSKGQYATAYDVNSKGEVVGSSNAKLGTVAVMWRLP